MAKLEIERKYLVDGEAFLKAIHCDYCHGWGRGMGCPPEPCRICGGRGGLIESRQSIEQGYFNDGFRVRISGNMKAWLTIKGKSDKTRRVRPEYEYEIPFEDGRDMLGMCTAGRLSKMRYGVKHAGNLWEVDQFAEPLHGLWLAEIELTSIDQEFKLPPWVSTEVTQDKRYSNASLAKEGRPALLV